MNTVQTSDTTRRTASAIRTAILLLLFVSLTMLLFLGFRQDEVLQNELQDVLYPLGAALVLRRWRSPGCGCKPPATNSGCICRPAHADGCIR